MIDRFTLKKEIIVIDRETGLMWQRQASPDPVVWKEGFNYINQLNEEQFGGYSDWRYPTKDELESLILPEECRTTGLYINPLFGTQRCCWSSTEADHHRAVYADFYYGDMYLVEQNYANYYIRGVRTM